MEFQTVTSLEPERFFTYPNEELGLIAPINPEKNIYQQTKHYFHVNSFSKVTDIIQSKVGNQYSVDFPFTSGEVRFFIFWANNKIDPAEP